MKIKIVESRKYGLIEEIDSEITKRMGYPERKSCLGCYARNDKSLCDALCDVCLKHTNCVWKGID